MNILVSACLLGISCRYDGKSKPNKNILELLKKHNLIPVCPEIYGGLPTPRIPAEVKDDKVIRKDGVDVTKQYQIGAHEALKLAKLYDIKLAILKEKSPSCGYNKIYDGSFSKNLIEKQGITAKLFSENNIKIIGETCLNEIENLK